MPSGAPPRRFAPIPVETSSKSSRPQNNQDSNAPSPPPRKFAVEPLETTSKSSRNASPTASPTPFAPESSGKTNGPSEDVPTKPKSRFTPQPFETFSKSSKKSGETMAKPKSRFAPQPFETSTKSNRSGSSAVPNTTSSTSGPTNASTEQPVRRRFAPMLIDTAKRSRKSIDDKPTYSEFHKTDVTPGMPKPSYHNSGQTIGNVSFASESSAARYLLPSERRRTRSQSQSSTRTHSFRMPDLETIESSESSGPPSLSSSPSESGSPLTAVDTLTDSYKHATRRRESIDEGVAEYMLSVERKRTEKRLLELANAAYPNSDQHEPVAHYVDDEDFSQSSDEMEIDDRPATWEGHDEDSVPAANRQSTTTSNWELKEMRDHHAQLEQDRNAAKTTARRASSAASPWWNPAVTDFAAAASQQDPEMRKMRDRARPPMLGGDIRFPRSASPEPARFDVTQGSQKLRHQMCYLSEQSESHDAEGLWGQQPRKSGAKLSSRSSRNSQNTGLWGGFCVNEEEEEGKGGLQPPRLNQLQSGLMTPRVESGNPFERQHHPSDINAPVPLPPSIVLPLTPPVSDMEPVQVAGVLKDDKDLDDLMEHDYPDSFVTQVYNYLSLGYPTLARPFDEELAKISGVPVSELRRDDDIAQSMPKGYIRLGEDFEGRGDGTDQTLDNGGCARWKALKGYIREWARQEKNMVREVSIGGNWGTGARRGSWAW